MIAITLAVCMLIIAGFAYLAITSSGLALALILIVTCLLLLFVIALGGVYIYAKVGQARLHHAQTFATILEASKIADSIQAVALPTDSKLQFTLLPARANLVQASANVPELITAPPANLGLPTAPLFAKILQSGFMPTRENLLLGYNHAGAIYGDITALLSCAVAGRPGQGKSSLLRLVAAQMLQINGMIVTLDPHGSISEDVPINAVFNASTASELDDAAYWLNKELDNRLFQYKQGKRDFTPLMSLNDEFPVISLSSKDTVAAIGRIVLEGRKVKMFSLISGQGLPASQFGGSLVRDALSSRYIFQTTSRQGSMAGLDKDAVKLLDKLDVGRCILDGPTKPQIVAIPYVTTNDLSLLTRNDEKQYSSVGNDYEGPYGASGAAYEPTSDENIVEAIWRELPEAEPSIVEAYKAYKEQGATTVRKMREALHCSQDKAMELLNTIKNCYS